jgi:two-component system, OmpR family, sensor kinase
MPLIRRTTTRLSTVPLRTRLVAVLVAAVVAALALTGYGVQRILEQYLVDQIDGKLKTAADQVAADQDVSVINRLTGTLGALNGLSLRAQFAQDGLPAIEIGGEYTASNVTGGRMLFPVPTAEQALHLNHHGPYTVKAFDGSSWRAVTLRRTYVTDEGPAVAATVTVAQNLSDVRRVVEKLRLLVVLVGGAATVACALLGWLAIWRAFRPLREVERTAAAIAAGDLSQRVPPRPATTEVGRLTSSLNIMLSRIESAFRAREASEQRTRRFAADASHELRTPLASIRGFAELYRQGAVPPDEVPRTMRRIEDEATRMGGLVEDLLLLARLDEQRSVRTDPVDLAVLANDALHDTRGLDSDRRLQLTGLDSGGPVPAVVIGDEDRLRQVVANLMANAIRHTPAGSPVEVAVGTRAGSSIEGAVAVLEVRDHGPGLSDEQAAKIFERFYRVDPSRQRGRGGGSGLGLSIVAAVVAAHHGQVEVRPTPGGGATFTVTLPVAPANVTAITADV